MPPFENKLLQVLLPLGELVSILRQQLDILHVHYISKGAHVFLKDSRSLVPVIESTLSFSTWLYDVSFNVPNGLEEVARSNQWFPRLERI